MTPEAVKQLVRRETQKVADKAANAIGTLQSELAGALLVNWALVQQAGGTITLPEKVMSERPAGAQLRVQHDPTKGEYTLSCIIAEATPEQAGAGTPE